MIIRNELFSSNRAISCILLQYPAEKCDVLGIECAVRCGADIGGGVECGHQAAGDGVLVLVWALIVLLVLVLMVMLVAVVLLGAKFPGAMLIDMVLTSG